MDDTEWGIDRTMHEQEREIDRLRAKVEWLTARSEKAEREWEEARAACSEACTEAGSLTAALEQERTLSSHMQERATAAEKRIHDLEAALRETHDALERLDAIYASEHDPDPVLGTVLRPAWLADALRHARILLTPTALGCQRCDGSGTEVAQYPDGSADVDPCTECNPTPTQKGYKE